MSQVNLFFREKRSSYLIFFLLSLFLVVAWFHTGKTLVGGEGTFTLFNDAKFVSQISPWQKIGLGFSSSLYTNQLIIVALIKGLRALGMSFFLIQIIFYFSLIFSGLVNMYNFANYCFGQKDGSRSLAFLSALFYLLNLYTMSQVLTRFVYPFVFAWSFLPLFLLLWTKCLEKLTLKRLTLFFFVSIVYSYTFAAISMVLTFWTLAAIWFLVELFRKRRGYGLLKIPLRALVFFLVWILANIWWIYPNFLLIHDQTGGMEGITYNINQITSLSSYFPNTDVFLLRQSFIFGPNGFYPAEFYNNAFMPIINTLVALIALFGFLNLGKVSKKANVLLIILFGWFISKGTNPPLGYTFYKFIFNLVPITEAWRNSYEKFGVAWVLGYSIMFALGVNWLFTYIKPSFKKMFISIVLFFSLIFLVWPMWTGDLFPNTLRANVPPYFKEANNFLNSDNIPSKVLPLPILPGDSVKYQWGYLGIDPSEYLFDKPAIARPLPGLTDFTDKYLVLYGQFTKRGNYDKSLDELGIEYLIVRNDVDSSYGSASSSADVKKTLSANQNISYIKSFGQLDLYKYNSDQNSLFEVDSDNPKILFNETGYVNYQIKVLDAKQPFKLFFKESFNNRWEATINGKVISDHFKVFDYANGWLIKKIGSYDINVRFNLWPWSYF